MQHLQQMNFSKKMIGPRKHILKYYSLPCQRKSSKKVPLSFLRQSYQFLVVLLKNEAGTEQMHNKHLASILVKHQLVMLHLRNTY